MNLTTHAPKPTRQHLEAINRILAHASPPVTIKDILIPRPSHRISSWRGIVLWVMNRHHGIPQNHLAEWLGMSEKSPWRIIRSVDRIVISKAPENASVRNLVREIVSGEGEAK